MLTDAWAVPPWMVPERTLAWMPVDCTPLGARDVVFLLRTGAVEARERRLPRRVIPLAMSSHGQDMLTRVTGLTPELIPHAVDCGLFRPLSDAGRRRWREQLGAGDDEFLAVAVFSNADAVRKATPELLYGFRMFHVKHPHSRLYLHTSLETRSGLDIMAVVRQLGLTGCVQVADQLRMRMNAYSREDLAGIYGAADVTVNATCGEGFGVPAIESQACGTPVILSDGTSGRELCGPGWLVRTEPVWNPVHEAWWHRPLPSGITVRLEHALARMGDSRLRAKCREFAVSYDVAQVAPLWDDVLKGLQW